MGKINAGAEFGQAVAQPQQLNEVAMPRAAFGSYESLDRAGAALQQQGMHDMQQAQAMQQRLAQQDIAEQVAVRRQADAATAQSKLLGMRDSLADALDALDRGVQDGSISKADASKTWEERSKQIIDDGLVDLPEAHRQVVQTDVTGLASRLNSKVADAVRRRDQSDIRSSIDATLEHASRLAIQDPQRARDIVDATLQANGPAAGLKPEVLAKLRQNWVETSAYTRAYSAVNAAKGDNRLLTTVEQGLQGNSEIDPQKKAVLLAQIENYRGANEARALRQAQHAEIVAARRQRESDSAFATLSTWALSGRAANPDAAAGLLAKLTPEAATAYKAMAAEIPKRTALAMRSLPEMDQYLDQLNAQALQQGMSQPLADEIKRAQQVRDEARKDYAAEPLRAAFERGVLDTPLQPLDTRSVEGLATGIAARVEQARTVQTRLGKPVSPLLAEEADRVGRLLQALPVAQRADRVQQIASLLPPEQGQALAGQLVKGEGDDRKALGIAFALGAARTTNDRATGELVLKGAEALKAKTIKEEKTPVDGWRGQIGKQLAEVYAAPSQAEMAGEAARLILAGLVAEGASGSERDAKQAVRLAVGGDLRDWNGSRIVVPAGMELQDVRQKIQALTPADLARQAPDGQVYVAGKAMSAADFLARLPEAQLQTVGRGRYVVKAGGTYAANAQRRPIVLEVTK